jgi:hypothetical protein
MNYDAYRNGKSFGESNVRTYGLLETARVLKAAQQCARTRRERFEWLQGFAVAVALAAAERGVALGALVDEARHG